MQHLVNVVNAVALFNLITANLFHWVQLVLSTPDYLTLTADAANTAYTWWSVGCNLPPKLNVLHAVVELNWQLHRISLKWIHSLYVKSTTCEGRNTQMTPTGVAAADIRCVLRSDSLTLHIPSIERSSHIFSSTGAPSLETNSSIS